MDDRPPADFACGPEKVEYVAEPAVLCNIPREGETNRQATHPK